MNGDSSPTVPAQHPLKQHGYTHRDGGSDPILGIEDPWIDVRAYGATGDGTTDDTTAIKDAIDSISSGTIFFAPGTYLTDNIYYKSNIVFKGSGMTITTLKLNNSQDTPVFTRSDADYVSDWGDVDLMDEIENVQIRDLTVDGNYLNQTIPVVTSHKFLIFIQRVIGVKIINVEVKDGSTGGITLQHSRNGIIEGCIVSNNVQPNSVMNQIESRRDFNYAVAPDEEGGKHIFRNNVVDGNNNTGYGIASHYTWHDLIEGNVVFDTASGIGGESSKSLRIVDNIVIGAGIQLSDLAGNTPEGAIISNNSIYEPTLSSVAVGVRGIGIATSAQPGVKISNNTIDQPSKTGVGPTWGIITLLNSPEASVIGNSIVGPDSGSASVSGVIIWGSNRSRVIANHIETYEYYGIYNRDDDCIIIGNEVYQTNGGANSNGIHNDGSGNIINENVIHYYTNGIRALDSGTGNILSNNRFSNTTTPISEETQGNVIYGLMATQKIYRASAAPTEGTWAVGDICYKTNPSATDYPGWVCTTAGTPGTWTPLPRLGLPDDPLGGDGTAGRVLRGIYIIIENGTNASTLKCTVGSRWNGDIISVTDNIAKNATTGNFTLDAAGDDLTIEASGLTGNCVYAIGTLQHNASGADLIARGVASGNDIIIYLQNSTTAVKQDITTLVDTGTIALDILYITDA